MANIHIKSEWELAAERQIAHDFCADERDSMQRELTEYVAAKCCELNSLWGDREE